MRLITVAVRTLMGLLVLFPVWGAAQTLPLRSAIVELNVVEQEGDRSSESRSKVWLDYEGRRHSTESHVVMSDGTEAAFVTIQTGATVYVLNPKNKTAQEILTSEGSPVPFQPGRTPEYKRFSGQWVGQDTIAGHEADIYEYIKLEDAFRTPSGSIQPSSPEGSGEERLEDILAGAARQSKVRTWIWRGMDIPLKTIVDDGRRLVTTETVNIAVNVKVPERVFTIPKGYTITKLPR